MRTHLVCDKETAKVYLRMRAVSEDGASVGHLTRVVGPGEQFWGYSFEELWALGSGSHELSPRFPDSAARDVQMPAPADPPTKPA